MGARDGFNDLSHLAQPSTGRRTLNPPSAIASAVELGAAWAEAIAERVCQSRAVASWPAWPPFEEASALSARRARPRRAGASAPPARP